MYDTRAGAWTRLASMQIPRFAAGVATVSGRVYVFVGSSSEGGFQNCRELLSGIGMNEWRVETDMPRATVHLHCMVVSIPRHFLKASMVQNDENKKAVDFWYIQTKTESKAGHELRLIIHKTSCHFICRKSYTGPETSHSLQPKTCIRESLNR